jgi:DNA polymerase-3 subunit alpha (Gram-positive type)
MSDNYILNLNNDETRAILKDILKGQCAEDAFDGVEFVSAEFIASDAGAPVTISVKINKPAPPAIFAALLKYVESRVKRRAKYKFEFSPEIKIADRISVFWQFFAEEMETTKAWLGQTTASLCGDTIIVTCDKPFIMEKLQSDKSTVKMPSKIRDFFGVDAKISIVTAAENDAAREDPYIRGSLETVQQADAESEILTAGDIKGEPVPVSSITDEGRYTVEARIFHSDDYIRELKNDKNKQKTFMIFLYLTDEKDTIKAVTFVREGDGLLAELPKITHVRAQIETRYDEREGEITARIRKMKKISVPAARDEAPVKRVELHAHTVMSAMDSVMSIEAYIKTAAEWGHEAVAITDHGVVHAFPEAFNFIKKNKLNIKLIFGMEGYLVDSYDARDRTKNKDVEQFHIVLLVKNAEGLKNLYRLVSGAHMNTFYKKPRILRSELIKHRAGLILGTACYQGELYRAVLQNKGADIVKNIIDFYDYMEIQPNTNNMFMVRKGTVATEEGLNDINRKILSLAAGAGKPCVATGDVHFLREEDRIYREVLLLGQGYDDIADEGSADLSFKTTEAMLREFSYLGEKQAYEAVVENPRMISAMIDGSISPVPDRPHPPILPDADKELAEITWKTAREIYGEPLPPLVEQRVKRELDAIIGNKYGTLYMIAKKMVDQSNRDGYIVGSRGSVGSSITAYLCGISEVNPLQAHYVCAKCKYTEFAATDLAGVDLPDKKCPKCGNELRKDGFNIPFETFMGFEGEKMPDIDLNFSGDYQDRIHRFVTELFGDDKVFRAGTIVTIQEQAVKKDFLSKYLAKTGKKVKNAEMERLARGCAGVKRSTGQHAGGLMLVPEDKDIFDFTPIQYSPKGDSITTHFDFEYLHDTLVKVDALGHDLPTSLKRLCEELKINVNDISLNDKKTMKIFSDIKALGVDPKNYEHSIGTLGVPEYGTKFTRDMLEATKPKTFSELIYIAGLSHGTNVWLNNAEELIRNKTASLKEVISVRDDIMNYLINKGLPKSAAFLITERVRKGKGLSREDEDIMRKHKVPGWYIESCKKIKYMFPKAHAVAYAIMSFRIAYMKVHHPMYFYADYFFREFGGFDYEFAFLEIPEIKSKLREFKIKRDLEKKEKDRLKVLEVLLEMRDRKGGFLNVDLYESDPVIFKVKGDKLLLPLVVIPELGEKVAAALNEERKKGRFKSAEDMVKRTKVNKNVVEFMRANKIIEGMPASDQAVLF